MKKFFTILLKVITIIAFAGIIAFGTAVVINATAGTSNAYYLVITSQKQTPYDEFAYMIKNNIRVSVESDEKDAYGNFLNTAVRDLNDAINYYANYLVLTNKFTKDEQISLKAKYTEYQDAFEVSKQTYNDCVSWYVERYNDHEPGVAHNWSDFEKGKYAQYERAVIDSYLLCYSKGSSFFKELSSLIKSNVLSGRTNYTASMQMLKVAYADYAVFDSATKSNPSTSASANKYLSLRENLDVFSDADILTDTTSVVRTFVSDFNKVDIYRLVSNFNDYYNSVEDSFKPVLSSVRSFINDNF